MGFLAQKITEVLFRVVFTIWHAPSSPLIFRGFSPTEKRGGGEWTKLGKKAKDSIIRILMYSENNPKIL